jgi:phosphonate transport system substrate-binding protein
MNVCFFPVLKWRLLLVTALILALSAGAHAGGPWQVALKPDKDPAAMQVERAKLASYLEETTGRAAEVVVPLSAAVIAEGLRNGTLDAAYLSATEMVPIARAGSGKVLLANSIGGRTMYASYWLVKKDAPYESIADLRGHPVAFSSRTSTSGFLIPLRDLQKRGLVRDANGLEEFFGRGQVLFGTGYVSAVERVLAGDAEAAAVSFYVFDEDRHLTPEQKEQLRVLQEQGPVPTHVIAVGAHLSESEVATLRAAFLGLNEESHRELRDRVFTDELVEVEEETHLAPVREALELAGVGS